MCAHLPSLLCDDHLRLVPVELEPQGPVAQIHLRFPRHQSCLRGGELVKSSSLVRVSILLRVGVAGSSVALRRSVGQKAVVSSVSYNRMMGHVATGTSNRESWVRGSMLARVREHGGCWDWLRLCGWRKDAPFSCRSIEIMTDVRDSVKIRREFAPLDVPWCVLGVGKIVCLWLIRHLPRVFFQRWTSLQVVTRRYNRMVLQRKLWSIGAGEATAHIHKFLGEFTRRRDAILDLHGSIGSHYQLNLYHKPVHTPFSKSNTRKTPFAMTWSTEGSKLANWHHPAIREDFLSITLPSLLMKQVSPLVNSGL